MRSIWRDRTPVLILSSIFMLTIFSFIDLPETKGSGGSFGGGSGTVEDPYLIEDVDDLQAMNNDLSAHYALANDIDASGTKDWNGGEGFDPIGNGTMDFYGSLDGRNYTILDIFIDRSDSDLVGLFGQISINGTIANVNLENVRINGLDSVGGLAGRNEGNITRCSVDGDISGISLVGGLIGWNSGVVSRCSSTVTVTGMSYVGGLVGNNDDNLILGSRSNSTVRGIENVGGLVGEHYGFYSSLRDSSARGIVHGIENTGGIAGCTFCSKIINSSFYGEVFGNNDTGGIIGESYNSQVIDSRAFGVIHGIINVGGLVGWESSDDSIRYSFFEGDVTGDERVGGLVGIDSGSSIFGTFALVHVFGNRSVGGLVGQNYARITDSFVKGSVSGKIDVGGLAGFNYNYEIFRTYSDCLVKGNISVGGLIGFNIIGLIKQSFAKGIVDGQIMVGGLIGNNSGDVKDSYARSNVTGASFVGGLIGKNSGRGSVSRTYSIGPIVGEQYVGGLIGSNSAKVVSSFWDKDSSGMATSAAGEGRTTSEMMTRKDYIAAKWDFDGTWGMVEGRTYPILKWQDRIPPEANAGPDMIVQAGEMVRLNANASSDDIGISDYEWTIDSKTGSTILNGISPTSVFHIPDRYIVKLNVTDPGGNWDIDEAVLTVIDSIRPRAHAGEDITVPEDTVVILNGSGSTDNAAIDEYVWTFRDGDRDIKLSGMVTSYVFYDPGSWKIILNVTDVEGLWNESSVNVTVMDITKPVADAGSDIIADEDRVVRFNASNSADNVGIVNFTWRIGSDILYGLEPEYIFEDPGEITVLLAVSDEAGNTGNDTVNVSVRDNTPPVADAGRDIEIGLDDTFNLDGRASYDNVGIVNVTWTFITEYEVVLIGFLMTYHFLDTGVHPITLRVTDAMGLTGSDIVNVTVIDDIPPDANAGDDMTIYQGRTAIFNGSNSTDGIGISMFIWTFNDGSDDVTVRGMQIEHRFDHPGIYNITLTVVDDAMNSDHDTLVLTVKEQIEPVTVEDPMRNLVWYAIGTVILLGAIVFIVIFVRSRAKRSVYEE